MSITIDHSVYSTILFMDSMIALEGKPLATLPWKEIDPAGPILILVVPQVMKEIDKRKRDGRLAKRAREFNRLIGPAAESGAPTKISAGPPVVEIAFASCDRIDWDRLDELDPEEADARVIAQILHVRGIPETRRLFFSYDNNPIAMGTRHGLRARKMPDHWLLEPEPSPAEKEINKLKAQVNELSAKEPDLEASVRFEIIEPVQLYRVAPLSDEEQRKLVRSILEENPEEDQDFPFTINRDYSYEDRYRKYVDAIVPRHAATLHERLETHYGQVPFCLSVSNNGHVQAENLAVTLKASGGTLNGRFVCYPIYGPAAPRPRNNLFPRIPNLHQRFPGSVPRHEMEFVVGPNRDPIVEIHCSDFRHGRTWEFEGIACVDAHSKPPFTIEVTLTASNMRGSHVKAFELAHTARSVTVSDLVNLADGHGSLIEIPMAKQFREALEKDNREWFQFVGGENEDDDDG